MVAPLSGKDFTLKQLLYICSPFEICKSQTRNAPYLVVSSKITPSELAALTPRAKKMKLVSPKWVLDSVEKVEIQDPAIYQPISPVVRFLNLKFCKFSITTFIMVI